MLIRFTSHYPAVGCHETLLASLAKPSQRWLNLLLTIASTSCWFFVFLFFFFGFSSFQPTIPKPSHNSNETSTFDFHSVGHFTSPTRHSCCSMLRLKLISILSDRSLLFQCIFTSAERLGYTNQPHTSRFTLCIQYTLYIYLSLEASFCFTALSWSVRLE